MNSRRIDPFEVELTCAPVNKYVGDPSYGFEWNGFSGHIGKIATQVDRSTGIVEHTFEGIVDGTTRAHIVRVEDDGFPLYKATLDVIESEMFEFIDQGN